MQLALSLSEEQAEYLKDILEMWCDGHAPATDDVIKDATLESPEALLEAVDGMHLQHEAAQTLLGELRAILAT